MIPIQEKMTKGEYKAVKYYCNIRCTPNDNCGENCPILKLAKEMYGDEEI